MMSCPWRPTIEAVVCPAIRATDLVWDSCSSSVLDSDGGEIYGTSNLRGQSSLDAWIWQQCYFDECHSSIDNVMIWSAGRCL